MTTKRWHIDKCFFREKVSFVIINVKPDFWNERRWYSSLIPIAAAAGWQHFTFLTWQKLSCLDTSCSHDGIPSVHTVTNIFQNVTLFYNIFHHFDTP